MKKASGNVTTVPSINDINPSLTPSLVGFWKCNEGGGSIIKDYSGNGYDLEIQCKSSDFTGEPTCGGWATGGGKYEENVDSCWKSFPGYWTPYAGIGAMIDTIGTLLETGSKYIVYGCEQISDFGDLSDQWSDFDCGTYWAGDNSGAGSNSFPAQYGFNWALSITQHWFRMAWDDAGDYCVSIIIDSDIVYVNRADPPSSAGETPFIQNEPYGIAAAFLPSTAFKGIMSKLEPEHEPIVKTLTTSTHAAPDVDSALVVDTTHAIPASLSTQDNKFGLRGQDLTGASWKPTSGLKNFFVWAFDEEPPMLDEALKYLAQYPGKIPPWWIGR